MKNVKHAGAGKLLGWMLGNLMIAAPGLAAGIVGIVGIVGIAGTAASAAPPQPPVSGRATPEIVETLERGPHHRVVRNAAGSCTELATGMHYFADGQWQETREEFAIVDGRAVARHGPHEVALAANLNSPGAVTLVSVQRERFRSHLLGLAYTDAATGRSVMIASAQDCQGVVFASNQVLYEQALKGDCEADVRFTYTRRGFEQDVILRTAPPSPSEWNLDPDTTRLEVFTEFVELPAHRRTDHILRREPDRSRAARMAEPDLVDQQLDFHGLRFGPGLAFPLDPAAPSGRRTGPAIVTGKSLELISGRTFLIEKVDYRSLAPLLAKLPAGAAAAAARPPESRPYQTAAARILQPAPAGAPGRWARSQFAHAAGPRVRPGLVLDYLAFNDSLSGWHFRGDTTYLISGVVDLHGVTVLEDTVIKFGPGGALQIWGPLDCQTSSYRQAIFTARDDHSVGQTLGAAGRPQGRYAAPALAFKGSARRESIRHAAFRHADVAIAADPGIRVDLSHVQIARCRVGVTWQAGGGITFGNLLGVDLETAFQGASGGFPLEGEHGTFHRIDRLLEDLVAACLLTNSLLVAVTNLPRVEGSRVEIVSRDAGVFQTIAGGAHYLPASSPYRNAGTGAIRPRLRADLRLLTTEAPLTVSRDFTGVTELRPWARPDRDQPDLGYHYPCLDYTWAGRRLAAGRLSLLDGVAVGIDAAAGASGLTLESGAELIALGQPQRPTRFVALAAIQEAPAAGRPQAGLVMLQVQPAATGAARVRGRFVESLLSGGVGAHLAAGLASSSSTFELCDGQFAGGRVSGGDLGFAFTNCIFDRVHLEVESSADEPPRHIHHSFFRSGTVQIDLPTSTQVHARNNFFDHTILQVSGTWHHSHNGYVAGCERLPGPTPSPTDPIVDDVRFVPGPLGPFYSPAQGGPGTLAVLSDAGSDAASALGLAHHTRRADQTPEGHSRVDIGFHYVAVDGDGQPFDQDGDGLADYAEDANGNRAPDPGETSWLAYDSTYGLTPEVALEVFTPLQ